MGMEDLAVLTPGRCVSAYGVPWSITAGMLNVSRYRGGQRVSRNQTRYSSMRVRCPVGAWRPQVAKSGVLGVAPQRRSTQSLGL
jgi:hypothetical protein